MKKLSLLFLLSLTQFIFSQESSNSYSKWYIKPGTGINIPITKLFSGEITDNLIEYNDNSYYWQVISGNFFFSSKLGVEFNYQAAHSQKIKGHANKFYNIIEENYSNDYFIISTTGAEYDNSSTIGGTIQKGYLGFVYRIEKDKFIILPKIAIGFTSFYTNSGNVTLKKKNTNEIYKISYYPQKKPNDYFTFGPSISFGYKIYKSIIINMDVMYSYYETDIEYTEKTRNTFTNEEVTTNIFDYNKNIHTLSIGLSLILKL